MFLSYQKLISCLLLPGMYNSTVHILSHHSSIMQILCFHFTYEGTEAEIHYIICPGVHLTTVVFQGIVLEIQIPNLKSACFMNLKDYRQVTSSSKYLPDKNIVGIVYESMKAQFIITWYIYSNIYMINEYLLSSFIIYPVFSVFLHRTNDSYAHYTRPISKVR